MVGGVAYGGWSGGWWVEWRMVGGVADGGWRGNGRLGRVKGRLCGVSFVWRMISVVHDLCGPHCIRGSVCVPYALMRA
eukprot:350672-Chlamydomonas_euryale.AAC.4